MKNVPAGTRGTFSIVVGAQDLANGLNPTLPAVMATRVMVGMMELAAINAIEPYVEAGETSVGMSINVEHTAATPPGQRVTAEAEVTLSDGRRLEFNVRAFDEDEQIGTGVHRRAVIDLAKFNQRLSKKVRQ